MRQVPNHIKKVESNLVGKNVLVLSLLTYSFVMFATMPTAGQMVGFSLQTDKESYNFGEVVHIELKTTNEGSDPVTFVLPTTCEGFFFAFIDFLNRIVFSTIPGAETVCAAIITEITIQPGETKTVAVLDWNQVDVLGRQVPGGTYLLVGVGVGVFEPSVVETLDFKHLEIVGPNGIVSIDVKPGSDPNVINTRSTGTIPVAILSDATFDAPTQVEKGSLTFGTTGFERSLVLCNQSPEDVNGDGLLDQVCHFDTTAANFGVSPGFRESDTIGILRGQLLDGTPIVGRDSVLVLAPGLAAGKIFAI